CDGAAAPLATMPSPWHNPDAGAGRETSVAYVVELRFDDDLAHRVRALWQTLDAIGAGGRGPDGEPVPHVSLAVYDDEDAVDPALAGRLVAWLAARAAPIEIAFAGLGLFPTEENVLFLAPVVTPGLVDVHAAWHGVAAPLRAACRAHYLPGRWVPHCTLAMRGALADASAGLEQLARQWTPLSGTARSIALVRVPPVTTIVEHPLATREPDRPPAVSCPGGRPVSAYSLHLVGQDRFALADEGLEGFVDRGVERRRLVGLEHAPRGLEGARGGVPGAVRLPLLEAVVVGQLRHEEGGLEMTLGVLGAEIVAARA